MTSIIKVRIHTFKKWHTLEWNFIGENIPSVVERWVSKQNLLKSLSPGNSIYVQVYRKGFVKVTLDNRLLPVCSDLMPKIGKTWK